MKSAGTRTVNVLEMNWFRCSVGVSRMGRVRNEDVRRRAIIEKELSSRVDQKVLRWFGHVVIMDVPCDKKGVDFGSMWSAVME